MVGMKVLQKVRWESLKHYGILLSIIRTRYIQNATELCKYYIDGSKYKKILEIPRNLKDSRIFLRRTYLAKAA